MILQGYLEGSINWWMVLHGYLEGITKERTGDYASTTECKTYSSESCNLNCQINSLFDLGDKYLRYHWNK